MPLFEAAAIGLVTTQTKGRLFCFEQPYIFLRGMRVMAIQAVLFHRGMAVLVTDDFFTQFFMTAKTELIAPFNQVGRIV